MSILGRMGTACKNLVFGDTLIPQEFTIGLEEPQTEITVWLQGMGAPADVTQRCTTACFSPFMMAIALDEFEKLKSIEGGQRMRLDFCERGGKKLLGEIRLKLVTNIDLDASQLLLFKISGSTNYCMPRLRLWAHYLLQSYSYLRKAKTFDLKMTLVAQRAATVSFIRPHPICLVSLVGEHGGNIFPMNLMGELGKNYFGFALKDSRRAAHLVERAGRIAISNVPLSWAPVAFRLAVNHKKESIDWGELSFSTRMSAAFGIPVPDFAPRIREMEIRQIHRIGSHTFFVAQLIHDEVISKVSELYVIHGFYQAWRLKGQRAELKASTIRDSVNKRGSDHSPLKQGT